jgi:threonine synthase
MDILVSSNLERLLFELTQDPAAVRDWMADLARDKRFQVDRDTFAAMREVFLGDWVSNAESLEVIERVWSEDGYLMDPHTAVAWEVAERMRADDPVLVVSTAHWAKFGADVYKALRCLPYAEPLPADVADLSGVGLVLRVAEMTVGVGEVPRALSELDGLPVRFPGVVDAGREGVEDAIRSWLAG